MKDRVTTLLLLRREDEVLLAMKKRGFGAGRWNGVGGKLNPDENIEQALIRECQEEIGVTPIVYQKAAEHHFQEFHEGSPTQLVVHTYVCTEWKGEPAESEEMAPRWFNVASIPYDNMWSDDQFWLPQVLEGKLLQTAFELNENDQITSHVVTEVTAL